VLVGEGLALVGPQDQVGEARRLRVELLARESRLLGVGEPVLGGGVLDLAKVLERVPRDRQSISAAYAAAPALNVRR
jgi:hypothetical protein